MKAPEFPPVASVGKDDGVLIKDEEPPPSEERAGDATAADEISVVGDSDGVLFFGAFDESGCSGLSGWAMAS